MVRWNRLFADLDARMENASAQERAGTVAELVRAEEAGALLVDRLRAAGAGTVVLQTYDGASHTGVVAQVATQWVLLEATIGGSARDVVVPTAAIETVGGLGPRAAAPREDIASRLTLSHALRRLARDRVVVEVRTRSGSSCLGRIDRVGSDHLDVAAAYGWGERGARDARATTVAFSALASVAEAAQTI